MISECGKGPTPAAYVYWIYDGTDLLYVGCTENLHQRLKAHGKKDWMPENPTIQTLLFLDARDAYEFETAEIDARKPKHDMTWKRRKSRPKAKKVPYICKVCGDVRNRSLFATCTCNGRMNRMVPVDEVTRNQMNRLCGPRHKKPKETD